MSIWQVNSQGTSETTVNDIFESKAVSLSSSDKAPLLADTISVSTGNAFNDDVFLMSSLSDAEILYTGAISKVTSAIISISSTSIIDILSSSAHFSTLLGYIRIFGLVPSLNFPEGEGITLVAPLNSAFAKAQANNVEITKELILYHIISSPVLHSDLNSTCTELVIITWDDHAPLLITGTDCNETFCHNLIAGSVPLESENSTAKTTAKGIIQVTDTLLEIPKGLCETLENLKDAKIFSALVQLDAEQYCNMVDFGSKGFLNGITMIVPLDSAFKDGITEIELKYLFSSWGKEDRAKLLLRHTLPSIWGSSDVINGHLEVKTADNSTINFSSDMSINGTLAANEKNLLFKNGLLHTYKNFAIKPEDQAEFFGFNIRKYLYGAGAASFLREVEFRGLSELLDDADLKQTIFVPMTTEDTLEEEKYAPDLSLPEPYVHKKRNNSERLLELSSKFYSNNKALTLYHFLDDMYDFDSLIPDVGSSVLVNSRMSSKRLSGFHQKIKVTRVSTDKLIVNNHDYIASTKEIRIGNCRMYLLHDNIYLPPSLSESVGPIFRSSRSMSYLSDLNLLTLPSGTAYTFFLPTTSGWENLGLVTNYLEANTTALRILFENIIVGFPFYTNDEKKENVTLLSGVETSIEYDYNRFLLVSKDEYAEETPTVAFPIQGGLAVDILFDAGVAHPITNVPLPHTLTIGSRDLLEVAGAHLFIDLLDSFNLSYVLDPGSGYSILAPSARSLSLANITADTPNIETLLKLHILPDDPRDALLSSKEGKIRTLIDNVHLQSREISEGVFLIRIVEGHDRDVRVLNKGSVNPPFISEVDSANRNISSMIIVIDRPLLPSWITPPSPPSFLPPFHDHIKTPIAVGLGIVLGVIFISFMLSFCFCVFIGTEPSADLKIHHRGSNAVLSGVDEENGIDADDATTPLLHDMHHPSAASLRSSRSKRSNNSIYHSSSNLSLNPSRTSIPEIRFDNEHLSPSGGEGSCLNKSAEAAHSEHSVSQPIKTANLHSDRKPLKFAFR
ncbi:hypothetical protein NADFUDRAFT_45476 [Nadsonia fulvescens var. elongata DSM 6958]|uniref:FAS1 domain-containing protein n=1 Tax=Nadsonia fulvescens var. elongata DSM 6958 TaxID=857566 RepID=A0A1E3PR06_9ASCO|nr:hypothetical protein NADFUDRAFT_45476 [Nadsonia fulvescens var. elongata DSM 6958]